MIRVMRTIPALPFFRVLLAVTALAFGSAAPAQTQRAIEAQDLNAWLDGYMPYAMRTGDIAGAVVAVVKDGRVVTQRGYGWANVAAHRPADPERTLFRVGSISKLVTWTAVMQQVQLGRLDLDHDVNAYLDFKIPPFEGKPITLRQLMTHTAGFEQTAKDVIGAGPPIPLDHYLKRWVLPRIFEPGTTPAYSNWGAALAGYIVQRVAHEPFAEYAARNVFAPLGMAHSTFYQPLDAALEPLMAQGYALASAPPGHFEVIGPAPAGALSATGADMARFMIAHLDNGRGILSPATAAMMHQSPIDKVNPASLIPPLDRMELGFIESNRNGHEVIGHRGDTQLFHSTMQLFLNDHVGLFASINSEGRNGAGQLLLGQLLDQFADRYFPGTPATTRVDPAIAAQHAELMRGYWLASGRASTDFFAIASLGQVKITAADGRLVVPSLKDPAGVPIVWDEITPFVWQARGLHERLAAKLEGGKPVRWSTDTIAPVGVYDRPPPLQSAAWLYPALAISLGAIVLTLLYWPATALIRWRYNVKPSLSRRSIRAARVLRVMLLCALAVLVGWVALLAAMLGDFSLFSARTDWLVRLLEIAGVITFFGTVYAAAYNIWLSWTDGRRWIGKLWSVVLLLSILVILHVALQFGLIAMTVHY